MDKITNDIKKLIQEELQKQAQKGVVAKKIRVMVVGIPNVGKSTFINHFANKNVAQVGDKPGITKQKQWVRLDNNIELLDTPGMLWPKLGDEKTALKLAYTGTIKDEVKEEVESAIHLLKFLHNKHLSELQERYNLTCDEVEIVGNSEAEGLLNLMEKIARKRGAILSGGRVDELKIARIILSDFRTCKFGKITIETLEDVN